MQICDGVVVDLIGICPLLVSWCVVMVWFRYYTVDWVCLCILDVVLQGCCLCEVEVDGSNDFEDMDHD